SGVADGGTGPSGESIDLVDAVRGETSGPLTLSQGADGGNASLVGGNGSSTLHRSGAFQSLTLEAAASGGFAIGDQSSPVVQHGGNAFAAAEGSNTGSVTAQAFATGGQAFWGFGGSAEAHSTAQNVAAAPGGVIV